MTDKWMLPQTNSRLCDSGALMSNVTAEKRASKKANHRLRHSHPEHVQRVNPDYPDGPPLPVNCPVCRPKSKTWDRDLAGKAVDG